jgi:predicted nucleic acid-binding protein
MKGSTKIFLDSSVLVEYFKERTEAVELVEYIFSRSDFRVFVNDIVYSEVAYIFIRTKAGKSHLTLKRDESLVRKLGEEFLNSAYPVLETLEFLEVNRDVVSIANEFIVEYGLLPNDALILATCKFYKIDCLVSLDEDFKKPCKDEGMHLVSSLQDLKDFESGYNTNCNIDKEEDI